MARSDAAAGPLVVFSLRHFASRVDMGAPVTSPTEVSEIAAYIRLHTRPEERIASFNATPRLYLEARRRPVTDSIVFLPWQARWEAVHPAGPSTCDQIRRSKPRYVFLNPVRVWNLIDWSSYGGCIDAFVRANYRRLPDPAFRGFLWENVPDTPPQTADR